jgi:hypothetical protein
MTLEAVKLYHCTTVVKFLAGYDFCFCHDVQTGSWAHRASCPVGAGVLTSDVKRPLRETDYSPASSAEIKNVWRYASISTYVCVAWCLVKYHGQLYLATSVVLLQETDIAEPR